MAVSLMLEDGGSSTDEGKRAMNGIRSFFATASNPSAQLGVFHVSGGVATAGVGVAAKRPELNAV